MPKLRKVHTLPNGRKVSDIDAPAARRRSHLGYADMGEECVIVDLTRMEETRAGRTGFIHRRHSAGSFLNKSAEEDAKSDALSADSRETGVISGM